jgi:hypothetical protein
VNVFALWCSATMKAVFPRVSFIKSRVSLTKGLRIQLAGARPHLKCDRRPPDVGYGAPSAAVMGHMANDTRGGYGRSQDDHNLL